MGNMYNYCVVKPSKGQFTFHKCTAGSSISALKKIKTDILMVKPMDDMDQHLSIIHYNVSHWPFDQDSLLLIHNISSPC